MLLESTKLDVVMAAQCSWQHKSAQTINFGMVDRFKSHPGRKQMKQTNKQRKSNKKQENKPQKPRGVVLQMGFFLQEVKQK